MPLWVFFYNILKSFICNSVWVDVCRRVEGMELARATGSPGVRLQVVGSHQRCWELKSCSLEQHCVLLVAKPSHHLHPLNKFLKKMKRHFQMMQGHQLVILETGRGRVKLFHKLRPHSLNPREAEWLRASSSLLK